MPNIEYIEWEELPRFVEIFAGTMLELANQSERAGMRDIELTARDAAEGLLSLLDVLLHRERTVPLRTV